MMSYFQSNTNKYIELNRTFLPFDEEAENELDTIRLNKAFGLATSEKTWDDLIKKPRVVILAEPGTGKTAELRAITARLRSNGYKAFF